MKQMRRILEIHRRLQAGRRFTALALGQEFHCTERTIRRDLDHMRHEMQLPIEFDRGAGTWFCTSPAAEVPGTLVSAEDRLALLVARQAVEQLAGTPWHAKIKSALARLLNMLPDGSATHYERVAARIRFEGTPAPAVDARVWATICNGIEECETLLMTYKTGRSGEVRQRRIDPYGMVVRNREWFLIGWDHYRKAVRTFFLPRIQAIDYTDEPFKVRDGFDLDAYLATAVDSHQSTGPTYRVKLRFTADVSALGEEYVWNATQRVSRDEQERVIVEFGTGALYAVERQVLTWGGKVEVLEPASLRRAIVDAASRLLEAHNASQAF